MKNQAFPIRRKFFLHPIQLGLILLLLLAVFQTGLADAGDLDPTFGVSSSGIRVTDIGGLTRDNAYGVAQQTDGKIIVVGSTDNDFAIVRYTSAGNMDATFSGDGIVTTSIGPLADTAYAVAVQTDGKILVAGSSDNGTFDVFALARYTTNGTLDATFGTGGIVTTPIAGVRAIASALVIQQDGKIVVTGESNNVFTVVRYTSSGALDTTFDGDGIATTTFGTRDQATSLALQSDGKIVVLGMSDMGSEDDFSVARFNSDGSLDFDFNGSGKTTVSFTSGDNDFGTGVAIQPDGKIVLGGYTDAVGTRNNFALARLNANGTLDTGFGTNGKTVTDFNGLDDFAQGLVIQPTGHIVLGGFADSSSTFNDYALARYTSTGILDTTFGMNGKVTTDLGTILGGASDASDDQAFALLVQPDNKLVLAGVTDQPVSLGDFNFGVARYLSVNNPPTVSNVSKTGSEDTNVSFTASDFTAHFSDPDGDLLNKIKVTSLPANGTLLLGGMPVVLDEEIITANLGNLVFEPAENWSGSTSFGWNGFDGLVYATTGAFVNLTLTAVNDAPMNTVPAAFNVNEDTAHAGLIFGITDPDAGNATNFQFTLTADHGTLTVSTTSGLTVIAGGNGTASMTYQGTLSDINTALNSVTYQGVQNYAGADTLTLSANDNGNTGSGGPLTDTDTVAVTVNPINDAPALSALGNQTVNELVQLSVDADANDVDGDTLTFSLDPGFPTGASIDSSTGLFTWTPTEAQGPGAYPITIRVTDNGTPALSDFETITVSVNEINLAPTLDPLPNQTVNELSPLAFTANAADIDLPANTLTFSVEIGAPDGVSIDSSTGLFTWTPTEAQGPGIYPITIRVTDDGTPALFAAQTFTITVNEVNAIPTVSNFTKTAPVNTSITFALSDFTTHFNDGDGDTLVTIQITALPTEGTLELNGVPVTINQEISATEISLLVFVPASDWSGSTSFTWTGSDGSVYASSSATVFLLIDKNPYDVFLPLVVR
ncbi:MAG: tandem-95 repeat protein [Anaerolineales bacterium]|nr:tandem-95 repeat protein [Anaerolineales bacterium]